MPPPLLFKPAALEPGYAASQRGVETRRFESGDDLFVDELLAIELQPASDLFDDDANSFSQSLVVAGSASRETSCSGRSHGHGGSTACDADIAWNATCGMRVTTLDFNQVNQAAGPPPGLQRMEATTHAAWGEQDGHHNLAETRTTIMLQRLPYHLAEWDVCRELDALGFAGKYDAVAVPRNHKRGQNLGYAFINFLEPSLAAACIDICAGRPFADARCGKTCYAEYSKKQGSGFIYDCLRATAAKQRASGLGRGVA